MRNDKAIRRPCVGGKHKTSHAVFIQRTTQHGRVFLWAAHRMQAGACINAYFAQ